MIDNRGGSRPTNCPMKRLLIIVIGALALAACGGAVAKDATPAPTAAAPVTATALAPTTTVAPTTTTAPAPTTTIPVCATGTNHPDNNPYICIDDAPAVTTPPTTAAPNPGSKENPFVGGLEPEYCLSTKTAKGLCDYWSKVQVDMRQPTPAEIRKASRDNPAAPEGQHWVEIGFIGNSMSEQPFQSMYDSLSVKSRFKLVGDKGVVYEHQNYALDDPNDELGLISGGRGLVFGNLFFLVDDDDANLLYVYMGLNTATDKFDRPVFYIAPNGG
jgi:hypothetical protein